MAETDKLQAETTKLQAEEKAIAPWWYSTPLLIRDVNARRAVTT